MKRCSFSKPVATPACGGLTHGEDVNVGRWDNDTGEDAGIAGRSQLGGVDVDEAIGLVSAARCGYELSEEADRAVSGALSAANTNLNACVGSYWRLLQYYEIQSLHTHIIYIQFKPECLYRSFQTTGRK